jgi:hypothetical protein
MYVCMYVCMYIYIYIHTYIYTHKNRKIQGCEVNGCLHLDATKPKIYVEQSEVCT